MLPRKRTRAHFAPNSNGSVGLLVPKERRRGAEGRATPARTAVVILAKRNTLFSSSKINVLHRGVRACRLGGGDSPSPVASDARQTAGQVCRAASGLPGAQSDNFPLPAQHSLFGQRKFAVQQSSGKLATSCLNYCAIWRTPVSKSTKIARNSQSSLLSSLLSGNSPCRIAPLGRGFRRRRFT